ncbi:MAG: hypothetical protein E6I56_03015 [Chloroflexi bacterium]|nr:MAG: hypothetical protein E6I56_03015 [Chloroflexota bacterium]
MREAPAGVVSAKVLIPHLQSLARERVDTLLNRIWGYRVGLVVAPAGSGKSTLLAGFASAQKVPVAWYRAESWDAKTTTMLNHLESAFAAALGPLPGNWDSVETAARGLESWPGRRALLVIDDLHALEDSPAERTLERLIDYAPPSITFLIGSRALPLKSSLSWLAERKAGRPACNYFISRLRENPPSNGVAFSAGSAAARSSPGNI